VGSGSAAFLICTRDNSADDARERNSKPSRTWTTEPFSLDSVVRLCIRRRHRPILELTSLFFTPEMAGVRENSRTACIQ
jgi:hypothetical protein